MIVSRKRSATRAGFTLMEVMLVLVILVVLASLAAVAIRPMREAALIDATKSQIAGFETPLESYMLHLGDYPTTDQGLAALHAPPSDLDDESKWRGPYLNKSVPDDPWQNVYQYEFSQGDATYHISSWGPNGISGDDDDISNLEEE